MRVLYVVNGLGTGGAERSLAELAPHLSSQGVQFEIVCLFERDEGVQDLVKQEGIPVSVLESHSWPGRVLELRSMITSRRPDLIQTTITESDIVGRLAAAGTGRPVITSYVNDIYGRHRRADRRVNQRRLKIMRWVDGWTARNLTEQIHALTGTVADAVARDLGVDREGVRVIGRGRSTDRLGGTDSEHRATVRRDLGLDQRDPVLVTVGRQEWQKGQETAIKAHALVLENLPNATLLIVGRDGNASATLRELIESLGVSDQVRILGHRSDAVDIMATSDVFLFPSRYEGFGGALIEAMGVGVPSVVSDIPVLREVAGEAVLFADAEDPSDFASKTLFLLGSRDERERLEKASVALFHERYRIEVVAEQMLDLYRSINDHSYT